MEINPSYLVRFIASCGRCRIFNATRCAKLDLACCGRRLAESSIRSPVTSPFVFWPLNFRRASHSRSDYQLRDCNGPPGSYGELHLPSGRLSRPLRLKASRNGNRNLSRTDRRYVPLQDAQTSAADAKEKSRPIRVASFFVISPFSRRGKAYAPGSRVPPFPHGL